MEIYVQAGMELWMLKLARGDRKVRVGKVVQENKFFILFLILWSVGRISFADWSPVPTGSMEPTIVPGDVLLIDKTAFGPSVPFLNKRLLTWGSPDRGDIITFIPPHEDILYVKRVIGIPGDLIQIEGAAISVNGAELPQSLVSADDERLILEESLVDLGHSIQYSSSRPAPSSRHFITVPDDKYFVMGDHRNNSSDSRYWGFVDAEKITGKVDRVMLSLSSEWPYLSRVGKILD